ncbi:Hypothetical protein FKW44_005910, partial [Caligus rogercresseyi]
KSSIGSALKISSNSSMTRGSSASTNLYVLELHSKTESSGSSPGFWEGPTDVMGGTIWHIHKKIGPTSLSG